jgi:hypothetical protein
MKGVFLRWLPLTHKMIGSGCPRDWPSLGGDAAKKIEVAETAGTGKLIFRKVLIDRSWSNVPPGANKDVLLASPIFYPFCSNDPTLYSCLIDIVSL